MLYSIRSICLGVVPAFDVGVEFGVVMGLIGGTKKPYEYQLI
jgi:hypothetical protein